MSNWNNKHKNFIPRLLLTGQIITLLLISIIMHESFGAKEVEESGKNGSIKYGQEKGEVGERSKIGFAKMKHFWAKMRKRFGKMSLKKCIQNCSTIDCIRPKHKRFRKAFYSQPSYTKNFESTPKTNSFVDRNYERFIGQPSHQNHQ